MFLFFPVGLHAFEHEGIQNITALKDQLIAAHHDQSQAILKRHADVMARYDLFIINVIFRINLQKSNLYVPTCIF